MSIRTRENLKGDETQQRRQALAKEIVDRIIRDTPRQISTEMYVREVAFVAYAAGWNAKANERGRMSETASAFLQGFKMPARLADECVRDANDNILCDMTVNADPSWDSETLNLILQHIADAINAYTPEDK